MAAKRGVNNANELRSAGVLSRYLVEARELDEEASSAWIFLDDYAAWLGQSERQIADLLCMVPGRGPDGTQTLDLIVTEAKYIGVANASGKASESGRQLRDTLRRLERALNSADKPADQFIWRARLSEMLRDSLHDPGGPPVNAEAIVNAVRSGECRFRVRGYSHVFAHAAPSDDILVEDKMTGVADTHSGTQEMFGPNSLRELLRAYADRADPSAIRLRVRGGQAPGPDGEGGGLALPTAPPSPPGSPSGEDAPAETVNEPAPDVQDAEPRAETHGVATTPLSRFRQRLQNAPSVPGPVTDADWLEQVSARCRNALRGYGMTQKLEQAILTPNAALLKFKGTNDLTVSSVERKVRELETTHGLSVLSVRSEPGLVNISIQRPVREVLTIGEVWRDWVTDPAVPNTRLLIAIKEDDGQPLFLEPEPAPHTLVAGSTGSGKSVLIQSIILAIAATNRPDQARIHLIDPKSGVDYYAFEPLPHLVDGIVDQPEAALERLDGLVEEMERRYGLFKAQRVSNIRSYNQKTDTPLPLIWMVHDEFADWMQIDSYRAGVEKAVSRLSVKARAAGIYLIFAAQRPDNTVFPMQLRSNLGNRLILRVDSAGTSDLSLGMKGGAAERLLGKGHLAAILGGGSTPTYAQVPFVGEDELVDLVDAICADLANPL
ncbi:hypothetical protein KOAAANKH_00705 [Brevundimonas sp. NIBR10]|uniref:FtsK/SpoIIIE domain-containing protein n=1 Tax=Brevundimonas sp. NIBR10 TaxID=3015997 RepID=UPI0022F187C3|nr:FtsK/SpoIIIE domain-containing protein [Brevundimonas sp. NIBR10]WGM45841.1 hypothetical protein KOAAANKH_00705 [Brevundimonas sp. NIBR10]